MDKRGTILVENIVFLILNLLFLSILVLFLLKQGSGAIVLEESYSKQIAMILDSAKPVMAIQIDLEKGKKLAESRGINFGEAVKIEENIVRVKLTQKSGYSYSFFNDVHVSTRAIKDSNGKYTGMYLFVVEENEDKTNG
jgi:hypothetical protein